MQRVENVSPVKINEDGSVSFYGPPLLTFTLIIGDQAKHYALRTRPYFSKMVEGVFKENGIEFKKEVKDTGCEQFITYKPNNASLPEVGIFQDGEATIYTGELRETLHYGGSSINFQDILTCRQKRRVVQDFRRFIDGLS